MNYTLEEVGLADPRLREPVHSAWDGLERLLTHSSPIVDYRQRKLTPLLKSLGISQAGYHAFRHFNVAMLDALRVPLKTIQERLGHAVTGSFTLDVYGGQPEWERNLEAAQLIGAELEKAVTNAENKLQNETEAGLNSGLSPIHTKGLEVSSSQAL